MEEHMEGRDEATEKALLERTQELEERVRRAEEERDIVSGLLMTKCAEIEAKHVGLITELRERVEDLEAERQVLTQNFQGRLESAESDRAKLVAQLREQLAKVEEDRDTTLAQLKQKCAELEEMARHYDQDALEKKFKDLEQSKGAMILDLKKKLQRTESERDSLVADLTKRLERAEGDLNYFIELIEKLLDLQGTQLAETEAQRDKLSRKLKKRLDENRSLTERMDTIMAGISELAARGGVDMDELSRSLELVKISAAPSPSLKQDDSEKPAPRGRRIPHGIKGEKGEKGERRGKRKTRVTKTTTGKFFDEMLTACQDAGTVNWDMLFWLAYNS
ncbi:putative Spindle pole protein [Giardia muris]|uniref:Putative Spindle pole protein n=1 Tax=Giardia muris TaxID=5742 RepID=A0A4Z1T2V7_GIAMU|nr:putative Spindle pole protein [Giardia muris]|eukprot:TNJ26899.1 putative Spindle pole protein [Giardia muris]